MRKHFFTGWQEEGSDTTEISLIQWIWIDSTETDVSALRSDTLGVSGCVLVTLFNMLGDFACVCHINKCLSRIYDACEIKEPTQLNSMYYGK
jgi:hypothetical protein